MLRDGQHHLGHPVAFGFTREEVDQGSEDGPAEGRNDDDCSAAQEGRNRWLNDIEEEVVETLDEIAKDDCAGAGAYSDDEAEEEECSVLACEQGLA